MNQEYAELFIDDLKEIDDAFARSSRRVLIPFRWATNEFPQFSEFEQMTAEKFVWWFPDESPRFRTVYTSLEDYCIESGSEVIECSRYTGGAGIVGEGVKFDWDDMTQISSSEWIPQSEAFARHIDQLRRLLDELCVRDPERVRYSRRLLQQLARLPNSPEWVRRASRKKRSTGSVAPESGRIKMRLAYNRSFEFVKSAIGLDGAPRPDPAHRPRYDDERRGPGFFRASVVGQRFENLTLPGLYIGRSELRDVSLVDSDLHLSTFNWTDFERCDFSRCDLHASDLRGCNFKDCSFTEADLTKADLRCSGFEGCEFSGAKLAAAMLHDGQRHEINLTDEQFGVVEWTQNLEEPEGG
ncbi:MAG: pentapeptide repeat-containing protein [Phycisphaerales bacterium]|nr:pentapeptide repeat-containing protein [Phycisphaerales bacterium]